MNQVTIGRRAKIEAYNSRQVLTPLIFKSWADDKIVKIPKERLRFNRDGSPNMRRLLLEILNMSKEHYSFNPKSKMMETTPGRNRSAIDIWRHVIAIYPEVSIFRVMEVLFSLCSSGQVFGQNCRMVQRTVFRSFELRDTDLHFECIEYGISFYGWKNLTKQEII